MTSAAGPGPTIIPAPRPVQAAGALICLEAVGVVALAVLIVLSGLRNDARTGQLLGQAAFFVVCAAAMVLCGWSLVSGRRWGRSPTIVVQVVVAATGYYLAVPSGRLGWGLGLIVLALGTGALLLTRPANDWISRFPHPFGPEPRR